MVKRQRHRSDEIMLIPFLDILCSLIGVLVLIIVVLVVAQTQRINGRTPEELQRAQEHQRMLKSLAENKAKYAGLAEKLAQLKDTQEQLDAKTAAAEKLKNTLENADTLRAENKKSASKLQKELEDLLTEIRGLTAQEPELKKKIQDLLAALEKIKPPESKDPAVVVNPSGSGFAEGTTVFFVDATGDKLTYYWNEKQKSVVSSVPEVIVADASFNAFLAGVKKLPKSKIIFLLRDDGMKSYNLGAGWAQSNHGYAVDQIGKLPIPGKGAPELKMFGKFLGSLPAPEPAP